MADKPIYYVGGYVQLGGSFVSASLKSNYSITFSLGGAMSVGVAGQGTSDFTIQLNGFTSLPTYAVGGSVYYGLGVPTGVPAPVTGAVFTSVDGKEKVVQVGTAVMTDLLEAGGMLGRIAPDVVKDKRLNGKDDPRSLLFSGAIQQQRSVFNYEKGWQIDLKTYPNSTANETNRVLKMGANAAEAAAQAEAEKQERGNRLLSQSIISAANYTNLSLRQQMEQKVDTSNQSLSEVSRLARAESSASAAKAAADAAAASQAAAAAAQAAREAFRASETEYTNSQGSGSNSGWSGWNSGPNQSSAETARLSRSGSTGDPIVIDLDGDGIDLYARTNSPARFDFDDDGYSETTAWAGPQDGILVIDEGSDNQITQSKEIAFAKWTAAEGDTDLEGLAATFDSNHDGVLDARDERYADFKVWKDSNLLARDQISPVFMSSAR